MGKLQTQRGRVQKARVVKPSCRALGNGLGGQVNPCLRLALAHVLSGPLTKPGLRLRLYALLWGPVEQHL